MSRVRQKGTSLELIVREILRKASIRYESNATGLAGTPDLVSREHKWAVFINGCFWHACPICKPKMPQGNREFWHKKIMDNKRRDKRIDRELIALGYSVMRLWGHEIKSNVSQVVKEIKIKIVRN